MYFYFFSEYPSAIKFNGIYYGLIQDTVKSINFDDGNIPLIEIASLGGGEPTRAFLPNAEFLNNPPENVVVTDLKGGYMIKFTKSAVRSEFTVLSQEKFKDLVVTVFNENGCKISIETPSDFYAENISFNISGAKAERFFIGSNELLAVSLYGESLVLNVYAFSGKIQKIFSRAVNSYSLDNGLRTTEYLPDMAKHQINATWDYSNGKISEISRQITCSEKFSPENLHEKLIPYAFAEEFLVNGDYAVYLTDNIKENADKLSGYLGNYIGVMPPPVFRNENEVGLIYRHDKNLYQTDYFIFETDTDKKIFNIKKIT